MTDRPLTDRHFCSLPMYDLPEMRASTDRLWLAIAARLRRSGIDAPAGLQRPEQLSGHWRDPALLLSQTCGLPLLALPSHVRVVATPCYAAEGCDGARYSSALVVRADDPAQRLSELRGRRCAINDPDSNSGMNLLRACVAPWAVAGRFFAGIVLSGSHMQSIDLVSRGRADLAAIDCVTLALARRYRPSVLAGLRILDWTMQVPGLPLITAGNAATVSATRDALAWIETDEAMRPVLDALLIERFAVLPDDAYAAIGVLARDAAAAGYPVLD